VTSHVEDLAARVKKIEAQPLPLGKPSNRDAAPLPKHQRAPIGLTDS